MLLLDLRNEIRNVSIRLETILRNVPNDNEIFNLAKELHTTAKVTVDYLDEGGEDVDFGDVLKLTEMVSALDISVTILDKKLLEYKKSHYLGFLSY